MHHVPRKNKVSGEVGVQLFEVDQLVKFGRNKLAIVEIVPCKRLQDGPMTNISYPLLRPLY